MQYVALIIAKDVLTTSAQPAVSARETWHDNDAVPPSDSRRIGGVNDYTDGLVTEFVMTLTITARPELGAHRRDVDTHQHEVGVGARERTLRERRTSLRGEHPGDHRLHRPVLPGSPLRLRQTGLGIER